MAWRKSVFWHAPQHFLDRHHGLRACYFPLRTSMPIVAQTEVIGSVSRREQFEGSQDYTARVHFLEDMANSLFLNRFFQSDH